MKKTPILLIALASTATATVLPSTQPPTQPAKTHQPQPAQPSYDEYSQTVLTALDSLNSILSEVKDKATADAAAEQAFAIYDELNKTSLPAIIKQTPEEEQRRVDARYIGRKEMALRQFNKHIRDIAIYEGYTSDRMCEFIVKLEEDRVIIYERNETHGTQTDPAKLQILEQELPVFFDKILPETETLNNLLQTVQDTASADAAANKLNAFMQKMEAERDRIVEKNGLPPHELLDRIIQPRLQRREAIQTSTEAVRKKLEQQNYYGSETLKNAMRQFSHLY